MYLVNVMAADALAPCITKASAPTVLKKSLPGILHCHMGNFKKVSLKRCNLTHCGLVMPYGDIEQGQHWLR